MYRPTTALRKIRKLYKRIRIVQGGSSAGKTVAIMLYLIDLAQREKDLTISVVSETVPHLKKGAMKDFLSIMKQHGYYKEERWNRTDSTYTFETGTIMEFFSSDTPGKVHGPRRDILFINEGNNISFEIYEQLEIRTNRFILIDFNPVQEFWVHSEIMKAEILEPYMQGDTWEFLIITYLDNEGLAPEIRQSIESKRDRKYFWSVYGLGMLGEAEGKVYKNWQFIDELPYEARLKRYGLDFGYTNDPTAIVGVYYHNGGLILDEKVYMKGLGNDQIAKTIQSFDEPGLVIADSAEPKSIDEIYKYGVNIQPALKGQGSVQKGIAYVQEQKISVTKRSVNIIKEYRNYVFKRDKEGRVTNDPEDLFNHAMDAIRYALEDFNPDAVGVRINQQQTARINPLHQRLRQGL